MPNHTTNLLSIVGEKKIQHLLYPYLTFSSSTKQQDGLNVINEESESFLDFEKIVPMPKEIRETCDMATMESIERMSHNDDDARQIKKRLETLKKTCLRKYGVDGWYDWSNKYWGTKWNSYENRWFETNEQGDEVLYFQTAWSPAEPVYMQLSKKLKKIVRVSYMDEGYGFFGVYHFYPNGSVDDECYTEYKNVPDELCDELGIESYAEQQEMEKQAQKLTKKSRN